ncbi:MAG: transglutaminase domain-containing protein [archaeon]|nr:transglutaminase domain-containing protein [archaeon]
MNSTLLAIALMTTPYSLEPEYMCTVDTFDRFNLTFSQNEGGINEFVLNNYPLNELDESALDYFQRVDEFERNARFNDETKSGLFERLFAYISARDNLIILNEEMEKPGTFPKLSQLIEEIDRKLSGETSATRSVKIIYETLSDYIPERKITEGTPQITEVLYAGTGDCADLSAALFSLLTHYRIPAYLRIGESFLFNESEGVMHAWVSAETEDGMFDLDLNWYSNFVPLNDRNEEINHSDLKEIDKIFKAIKESLADMKKSLK